MLDNNSLGNRLANAKTDEQINQGLSSHSFLVAWTVKKKTCQQLHERMNAYSQPKLQIAYWWSHVSYQVEFLKGL